VPTLAQLTPVLAGIFAHADIVAYGAHFDGAVVAEALALGQPNELHCASVAYAEHYGEWSDYYGSYKFQSLRTAATEAGHIWRGANHDALADCFALRDVWAWLKDPVERERLEAQKEDIRLQQQVDWGPCGRGRSGRTRCYSSTAPAPGRSGIIRPWAFGNFGGRTCGGRKIRPTCFAGT
jgi:hypothetical protein